jgi:hypothetical protein
VGTYPATPPCEIRWRAQASVLLGPIRTRATDAKQERLSTGLHRAKLRRPPREPSVPELGRGRAESQLYCVPRTESLIGARSLDDALSHAPEAGLRGDRAKDRAENTPADASELSPRGGKPAWLQGFARWS